MKREHFEYITKRFGITTYNSASGLVEERAFSDEFLDVDVSTLYVERFCGYSGMNEFWVCSDNSQTADTDYVIFQFACEDRANIVMQHIKETEILFA